MAPRTVYANLQDGLQPFSLFDQSFADAGNLGVIPCMAAGTNAIVLTPIAAVFAPTVAIPQALQAFSFVAAASSTGAVTIQVGTTTALKLYRMDGVTQAAANDILINVTYVVNYNAALNGAAGGFQILAPISNEINPIITGATISGSTITTSTYNGNTWTAGTGILTIAALKTLTVSNTLTFTGTDSTSFAFPSTSDTVVTLTAAQTLTNKTLTSPTLTTPSLGVATATSLNGNTFTTGTYTLTGTAAKTLTFNNSLTLAGTDTTTMTFPTTSATLARTDAGNTFTGTQNLVSLTISSAVATDGSKNLVSVTNTGSGNNVLATSPTLVTPVLGAATATSVTFSPTTGGIVGTTTNDNVAAGSVGEYVESIVISGSAVSLVTATAKTITSISLTAGDWDVSGQVSINGAGTAAITFVEASISLTTNTVDTTVGRDNRITCASNASASVPAFALPVGPVRFSLSATTTIFLVGNCTFTNAASGWGILRARRVR